MGIREELQAMAWRLLEISKVVPGEDEPTGDVVEVKEGEDLQKAINAAKSGRTLLLSGQFVGNFVIDIAADEPITIRGGSIISPNQKPALTINPGAAYWNFEDSEIATSWDKTSGTHWNLIRFNNDNPTTTPHHFIFLRCDIHGTTTGNVRRGFALNAASVTIEKCRITEFHEIGADSQGICGWSGPGPFTIVGNYIEAAGENIMFGGGTPEYENLVPTDIVIKNNNLTKPWRWRVGHPDYEGIHWSVKNNLELKNARTVSVVGNILGPCWADSQTGYAMLMTPRGENGKAPWSTVENVRVRNNLIRDVSGGFQISSGDSNGPSGTTQNITINENLLIRVNRETGGRGVLAFLTGYKTKPPMARVEISGNTYLPLGYANQFLGLGDDGTVVRDFTVRDNIFGYGKYGLHGSGAGVGTAALDRYCDGWIFDHNLILDGSGGGSYPSGNWFDLTGNVGFLDIANGEFALSETSDYKVMSSEGDAVGAELSESDFEALPRS